MESKPTNGRVLVGIKRRQETDGIVAVPETANTGRLIDAVVLAIGDGCSFVDIGDAVLIDRFDGVKISETNVILLEKDILAICLK